MKYDFLIVGSGLYGATFAYLAKHAGKRCMVIEKRPHTGGNIYCQNMQGINVHTYGAHIFHTDNKTVWNFVNQFAEFNRYTNTPVANYKGELFNLPFNMNTFYQLWKVRTPEEALKKLSEQRALALEKLKKANCLEPRNLEEQAQTLVGNDIYEKLIKGYTEKQWGRSCSELPAFIIRRLPVRLTFDNNYFNDRYQGIPQGGYNKLINGLLQDIEIKTGVDFFTNRSFFESVAEKTVYTGLIDQYFDYSLGKLEYRSLRFETEVLSVENYQGNAVINYTDKDVPYTRIIEHKHFEPESATYRQKQTVVTKEYSSEWSEGSEPFYPVNDEKNTALYTKYKELAQSKNTVIFGGRLAEYKYYDMDDVIEKVFSDTKVLLNEKTC
jgi:UDP-galactopyranose mutase